MLGQKIIIKPHEEVANHSVVEEHIEGMTTHTRYEIVPNVLVDELAKELKEVHQHRVETILKSFKAHS